MADDLDLNVWVTVAQAAKLVGRTERSIYLWIDAHRVTPRKNDDGVLIVRYGALLKAEAGIRRGRPRS
jgi:hypothetical protein